MMMLPLWFHFAPSTVTEVIPASFSELFIASAISPGLGRSLIGILGKGLATSLLGWCRSAPPEDVDVVGDLSGPSREGADGPL